MPVPAARFDDPELSAYAGRWVARIGLRIVGQGGTPQQARLAAQAARYKEHLEIFYVPSATPITISSLAEKVRAAVSPDQEIYLVGGAVRDMLLNRPTHDVDFVLPSSALRVGRQVADALGGAYYALDEPRQTARVILEGASGERDILDFSIFRGPDLESDLQARDFTINAIAIDLHRMDALLDPLGGASDLRAGSLRACSPASLLEDPLRVLRAVRLAAALNLHIQPETLRLMRQAAPGLQTVTPERLRDELLRTLNGPQPGTALRALDMLGVLPMLLPELPTLKGITQSAPHVADVWTHTLDVLNKLEAILEALAPKFDPDASANLLMGLCSMRLGRYRESIFAHLQSAFTPERPVRAILFLAALFHDVAKPQTRQIEDGGRIRFYEHERIGADIVAETGRRLRLSNEEITRLETIVHHHLRPMLLGQGGELPSRRAVYRFFRATGETGIDVCLLSLADVWATYGTTLPQETWAHHLEVVRTLLEAWFERPSISISPPPLLNGNDLILELGLKPGPEIGRILEVIREAQASAEVQTREEAFSLARSYLDRRNQGPIQGNQVV